MYEVKVKKANFEPSNKDLFILEGVSEFRRLGANENIVFDKIAILEIHNDDATNKDYENTVIHDIHGGWLRTTSGSVAGIANRLIDRFGNAPLFYQAYTDSKKSKKNNTNTMLTLGITAILDEAPAGRTENGWEVAEDDLPMD